MDQYFRIDRDQEGSYYVTDICSEDLYIVGLAGSSDGSSVVDSNSSALDDSKVESLSDESSLSPSVFVDHIGIDSFDVLHKHNQQDRSDMENETETLVYISTTEYIRPKNIFKIANSYLCIVKLLMSFN